MPLVDNINKDSYILKEIDDSVNTGRFPFISSAEFISDPIASVLNSPMRAAISPSSIKIQYPMNPSDVGERIDLADIVIKVKVDSTDPDARYLQDYEDNPKVFSIDRENAVILKNKYNDEIPEKYVTSDDLHEYEGEEIIVFLCRSNWDEIMGKWNIGLAFREGGIITQSNSNEWETVNSIIK